MKKHALTVLTTLFLAITALHAQKKYEPLELAQKIFSKDGLSDIDKYVTGDYDGQPSGKDLGGKSKTTFMLLGQTKKTAVIAMTIIDADGNAVDTYLHFEKDKMWKMSGFKMLLMTGVVDQIKTEFEKMTPREIDAIITQAKNKKKDENPKFESREEYNFILGNAKLILEQDENIIKHFKANQAEFLRLKALAVAQLESNAKSTALIESSKTAYQKLFISNVSAGEIGAGSCINFSITDILGNSVGYIYAKDKKDVPEMDVERVIMVREIGDGWYMYKTN